MITDYLYFLTYPFQFEITLRLLLTNDYMEICTHIHNTPASHMNIIMNFKILWRNNLINIEDDITLRVHLM